MHWKDAVYKAGAALVLAVAVMLMVAGSLGYMAPDLLTFGERHFCGFGFGILANVLTWGSGEQAP